VEGFLILVGCALALVPFVLPIVAIRRTRRIAAYDERLRSVEDRLIELTAENLRLRAAVEELETAPAPPPSRESAPIVAVAPEAAALAALDVLAAEARTSQSGIGHRASGIGQSPQSGEPGFIAVSDVPLPGVIEPAPSPPPEVPAPLAILPAPPVPPPPPPEPPKPAINWEQWFGVRGAAALGGIVLALAGILFFQYSIQHGLISPAMRVVIGTLVGVGCMVASTRMRQYGTAANALAGGGAVILYACFWAARALYSLIPMEAAFVLMALVTAATALLSARFSSLLIAALGLTGGFLTPLLLSTGANKPFGLFGYLLVLDSGFLLVAFKRKWGGLALFALSGTLLIEAMWVGKKMEPEQLAIGLGATGLFALLFLASGSRAPKDGPRPMMWLVTQAAAVLLPHAFALYFALEAHLGHHLYPVALLLVLLEVAALYVAHGASADAQLAFLPRAAGAGTLAVVASWLGQATLTSALAWEATLCVVGLSLPAVIWAMRRKQADAAALLYPAGLFAVLASAALWGNLADPWPFVIGLALLAGLVVALGHLPYREMLVMLAPAAVGAVLAMFPLAHEHTLKRPALYVTVEILLFVIGYVLALGNLPRRDALARRSAEGAILLGALPLLGLALWSRWVHQPAPIVFALPLGWALLLVGAVLLRGDGRWLAAAAIPALCAHLGGTEALLSNDAPAPIVPLLCCAAAVLVFTRVPLLQWPRLRGRAAFYVAALAGLAWLLPSLRLYRDRFGPVGQGGVALVYAAMTLLLVPEIRRRFATDDPMRKSALVWVAGAALGLLSIAIPVELERQWITIGYALETAALLMLWERLDHPGLKYFAFFLAGCVGARLVLNTSVLEYADRGSLRILNWVLYTYWVPAVSLVMAIRALAPLELPRLRDWELRLYAPPSIPSGEEARKRSRPLGVVFLGMLVVLIVFVWINLAIADWFGTGHTLTLDFERKPARDLTISIAWALYAIALLALGVWRRSSALRWVSLGMLVVTIGKVFLYDLGELKDLYRVVSLLGLAVSLIAVSLAYQRFVFRKQEQKS
jgi:hypothetical protein